ncbi:multiheme c-type cytochrome [Algimonas arctica]|nr:multiheme c-type cytochrome [Algimonas arctica]
MTDGVPHLGVTSCSGSTCHSRQEATGVVVQQNEISLWQDQTSTSGAHLRAYRVLSSERSMSIAKRLGISEPNQAIECLSCHADNIPSDLRKAKFQFDDGIGCESCHGGSEPWLAAHYSTDATHSQMVSLGLYALEKPDVRANVCLSCHVGSDAPGQFVDHRLMAAGHPRMSFELDLFTALQRHHDEDVDYFLRKEVSTGAQVWAVGQARALERQLTLFSNPNLNMDGIFPEPVFFDCQSCHQDISDDPNYRPNAVLNPVRPVTPGQVRFNDAHMIMLLAIAEQIAPNEADALRQEIKAFHASLSGHGDRSEASEALQLTASRFATFAGSADFNRERTLGLIERIADDVVTDRYTDYAAAEQAVMAIDTLLSSMVAADQVALSEVDAIRGGVELAYDAVSDSNRYSQLALANALRDLRADVTGLR